MIGMARRKKADFVLRIVLDQLEERAEGANPALYRNSDKERRQKPTLRIVPRMQHV